MTENKRFKMKKLEYESYFIDSQQEYVDEDEPNFKIDGEKTMSDSQILDLLNENEQLKKGMIGVVDRYIKNVDCNPPSSTRTYVKIKGALMNIREDLRDLIEDLK